LCTNIPHAGISCLLFSLDCFPCRACLVAVLTSDDSEHPLKHELENLANLHPSKMVGPAVPLPPGCPDGWPIQFTAPSGMQTVWGPPHSRQIPGHTRLRGIGIKMLSVTVPGYPEHSESWAGLYQQRLHDLFWRFSIFSQADAAMLNMVMHLPMMGMPPREPTEKMMQEVRAGQQFRTFFRYATVIKATDINITADHTVHINETRGPGNGDGDDVVIRLPGWPDAPSPEDSLYRRTMDNHGFEFRTHLPAFDTAHEPQNVDMNRLWFIQLLPNELPSYHFWARPHDQPWLLMGNRKRIDGPGSPHYEDMGSSYKQKIRQSPQNTAANSPVLGSGQGHPSPGPRSGGKRRRSLHSSSGSGSGLSKKRVKKPKTKTDPSKKPRKGSSNTRRKSPKGKRR
jgi:hypothetical protein